MSATRQRRLLASSRVDVFTLAMCFSTTPQEARPRLMGAVYAERIMRFRGIMRPLAWAIDKRAGRRGLALLFTLIQRRNPEEFSRLFGETVEHIIGGVDLEETTSVGGWSQREIDALQARVDFSFLAEPVEVKKVEHDWKWYAGRSEEEFSLGPFDTREDAIDEGRGNFDEGFFITEALKTPIDVAAFLDIDNLVETISESIKENCANPDGGDDPIFDPTPDQTASLEGMLKAEIRRWQELHGLNLKPWLFTATRSEEFVEAETEPADA